MISFIALTGFLGAGKTTTMTATALALQEQGRKVAVITNDQGVELVDTKLARSKLDAVAEVTGGCFCCKFEDLVLAIVGLVASDGIDTVIAEAVGSCTDLQATVVRPLREYYEGMVVAPLTTVVDPYRYRAFARAWRRGEPESDLSYLFRQQLLEADVIAVNKLDLLPAADREPFLAELREQYPQATVVGYSAASGDGLPGLLRSWQGPSGNKDVALDVDYDRYASAEAQLAWLNLEVTVDAVTGEFDATTWARTVLESLSSWSKSADALIGHAKLTVTAGDDGFAKLSLTAAGDPPVTDAADAGSVPSARAVINARVACEPAVLDAAVTRAVAEADRLCATTSAAASPVSFKPGYPTPVHRLAPTGA